MEVIADMFAEVRAFRFGSQKVTVLLRWEIEVAVDFSAAEL
jgi:hypothetical protein